MKSGSSNCIWRSLQDGSTEYTDETGKVIKQPDNPFIEPTQTQTVVDMKGA